MRIYKRKRPTFGVIHGQKVDVAEFDINVEHFCLPHVFSVLIFWSTSLHLSGILGFGSTNLLQLDFISLPGLKQESVNKKVKVVSQNKTLITSLRCKLFNVV